MEYEPLISIIMPTYNHSKYIKFTISSILAQTYDNWELFVIDDGSEDNTVHTVRSFKDNRINVIEFPHEGLNALSAHYNNALSLSNGELIAIIDGDDGWPIDKLKLQKNLFIDPDVVLSWGKSKIIDSSNTLTGITVIQPCPYKIDKNLLKNDTKFFGQMLFHNLVAPSSAMIRKRSLLSINGFQQPEGCPFVDYCTWLSILRDGKGYYLNETLGYWRFHDEQTTQSQSLIVRNYSTAIALSTYLSLSQEEKESLKINIKKLFNHRMYHLADTHWGLAFRYFRNRELTLSQKEILFVLSLGHTSLKVKAVFLLLLVFINLSSNKIKEIYNEYLI